MFQLICDIFSCAAYTSLAYVGYVIYATDKPDLSKISYAQDEHEYHLRMCKYYENILNDSKKIE